MRALGLLKIVVVSLLLPLNEGFVLTSDGEETVSVGREGGADNVLAMSGVAVRLVSVFQNGVVIHVHKTPIVTAYEQRGVWAESNLVNMGTILA